MMKKGKILLFSTLGLMLIGCSHSGQVTKAHETTTIDSALQAFVDSAVRSEMETINAYEGQALVMEVSTGAIKSLVGIQRSSDSLCARADVITHQQEMGSLMKVPTLLAAMETGRIKLTDSIETGGGVWPMEGYLMKDHNWRRGGYGKLTYEQALEFSSNIAISRALQKAFVMNVNKYLSMLDAMSFGQPDSIEGIVGLRPNVYSSPKDSDWVNSRFIFHAIGYERFMSPIQMLTFYNAIANGGKMVKPTLFERTPEVINEQIARKEFIEEMQTALYHVVSQGLGTKAGTEVTNVAGKTGTAQLISETDGDGQNAYLLSFCGYFPAKNPRYSIIVCLNKKGLPASGGGMAGPVFSQIAEYMVNRKM